MVHGKHTGRALVGERVRLTSSIQSCFYQRRAILHIAQEIEGLRREFQLQIAFLQPPLQNLDLQAGNAADLLSVAPPADMVVARSDYVQYFQRVSV